MQSQDKKPGVSDSKVFQSLNYQTILLPMARHCALGSLEEDDIPVSTRAKVKIGTLTQNVSSVKSKSTLALGTAFLKVTS